MRTLDLKVDITGCSPEEVFEKLRARARELPAAAQEEILRQIASMEERSVGLSPAQLSGVTLVQGLTTSMAELNTLHDGVVGLAQNLEDPEGGMIFAMGGAAQALGHARWSLSMAQYLLNRALDLPRADKDEDDTEGEA